MEQHPTFSYTYSARENQDVLNIRKKYLPRQETQLEELKRLDHLVQTAGTAQALCAGVIGCLLFGCGLCLAMEVIGHSVALGVFMGLCGAAVMLSAYPIHRAHFRKAKETHRRRILELSAQLCGQPCNNNAAS